MSIEEDQVKMFMENFLSLKQAEFIFERNR